MINFIIDNSHELLGDRKKDRGHILELLLLCSMQIVNKYRVNNPSNYENFQYDFLTEIGKYGIENNLHNRIDGSIEDFIKNRLTLYYREFQLAFDGTSSIPSKLAYNLFDTPLELSPGDFLNILILPHVIHELRELLAKIDANMNIVY